jgi:hypothetical protein
MVDESFVPSTHRPSILYWRLLDFRTYFEMQTIILVFFRQLILSLTLSDAIHESSKNDAFSLSIIAALPCLACPTWAALQFGRRPGAVGALGSRNINFVQKSLLSGHLPYLLCAFSNVCSIKFCSKHISNTVNSQFKKVHFFLS